MSGMIGYTVFLLVLQKFLGEGQAFHCLKNREFYVIIGCVKLILACPEKANHVGQKTLRWGESKMDYAKESLKSMPNGKGKLKLWQLCRRDQGGSFPGIYTWCCAAVS